MIRQAKFDAIQYVIDLERAGKLNKDGAFLNYRGFDRGIELIRENFNPNLTPIEFAHALFGAMVERLKNETSGENLPARETEALSFEASLNLKSMLEVLRSAEAVSSLLFYMQLIRILDSRNVAFREPVLKGQEDVLSSLSPEAMRMMENAYGNFGGMGIAVLGIGAIAVEDDAAPLDEVVKRLLDAALTTDNAEGLGKLLKSPWCGKFLALIEAELKSRLRS